MKNVSKSPEICLDSALRYIYHALRLNGGMIVAIEFTHRGQLWKADTVDEAVELRRRLERDDAQEVKYAGKEADQAVREQTVWTPDKVQELFEGVGESQKEFFRVLLGWKSLNSNELARKLSLDSQLALAGVLSGLSKQLRMMGIHPMAVYQVDVQWKGKKKNRFFRLARGFRTALVQDGWFDDVEEKKAEDDPYSDLRKDELK